MRQPAGNAPATASGEAPCKPRHAIILSGGGANGAYEVGILKALLSGKCRGLGAVDPELFFGTSIGSYNAAFLVSHWAEFGPAAVSNLERAWLEKLATHAGHNGVYRFRVDPTHFLNPAVYLPNPFRPFLDLARDGVDLTWERVQRLAHLTTVAPDAAEESFRERFVSLFDVSAFITTRPWRQTIRETIRFSAIRSDETRSLAIFATNWATGKLRTFENADMTDEIGAAAIEASSAVPGVFPEVYVGAEPYVDGGVLMNTPLSPALDAMADVLHVVYLDPDIASIPMAALNSTVAASYRLQQISWAALVERDIDRVARINRGLAAFERIQHGETLGEADLEGLAKGVIMVLGGRHLSTYRPVTVHRYHPREEIGSGALGLLNLDREHIESLIQKGFADATLHDCKKEKCVIPEATQRLAETLEAL